MADFATLCCRYCKVQITPTNAFANTGSVQFSDKSQQPDFDLSRETLGPVEKDHFGEFRFGLIFCSGWGF